MSVTFYAVLAGSNCLPCCNGTANYINVDCRTIGGTASMCGFTEYTSPSTPPKYYLIETLSGSDTICGWFNPDTTCSAAQPNVVTAHDFTGAITYNAANCSYVNTKSRATGTTGATSGTPCVHIATSGSTALGPGFFGFTVSVCAYSDITTQTRNDRTYDGVCCPVGAPASGRTVTGTVSSQLSNEDTDANAIARLLASSNYSAWANLSVPSCSSNYQARSSNSFTYQEAQYRANVSAANTHAYTLMAELWRAPSGFSNYALYSYQITPFTTNATGFASVIANVPVTQGYSTYVSNVEFF